MDFHKLASEATITKGKDGNGDTIYYFDLSNTEDTAVSMMGEYGATEEEAIAKVAERLEFGHESGDYRSVDDRD